MPLPLDTVSLVACSIAAALARSPSAAGAQAADAAHGKRVYDAQCALCHGPAGDGGEAPVLDGVVGRPVASTPFGYSDALRGAPTGSYGNVMTGFVLDDERVRGRRVGVTVAKGGSLLVSDDAGGVIWGLTWQGS